MMKMMLFWPFKPIFDPIPECFFGLFKPIPIQKIEKPFYM